MQELIPEVEKRFRVIREPYARVLSGRIDRRLGVARAADLPPGLLRRHLVLLPRLGDLHRRRGHQHLQGRERVLQAVRVAARADDQQPRGERPGPADLRAAQPLRTGERHARAARASSSTSGRRSTARSARTATSSRSSTSAPARSIRTVAQYWKDNYDLLYYLQRNWATVGPKLVDKIHVYTGTMDTYFLNNSTQELQEWMKTTDEPALRGVSSCTATASRTAGAGR